MPTLASEAHYLRAQRLDRCGRNVEARSAYLELLDADPDHAEGLNALGDLLLAGGEPAAARALYQRAAVAHPDHAMSRVNFGNALAKAAESAAACEQFRQALRIDANCRKAHAGLAFLLDGLGDPAGAARHRRRAFHDQCVFITRYRGQHVPVRVLELVSTSGGNVRTDEFLSDRVFQRIIVTAEFFHPSVTLPPHDLVVNAIGDADRAGAALQGALTVLAQTHAPVINPPAAVLATGRDEIARRLAGIPWLVTAKTERFPLPWLRGQDAAATLTRRGFAFPLLLRAPGFHGGEHFLRVDDALQLPHAAGQLPGDDALVIEYLDARGGDGNCRKYRVMCIDGRLYPLHAAVSRNWKIHYFSADMADFPAHRAEDEAFLADMPAVVGARGMEALGRIAAALGLDYGGIDFGLSPTGEVLLFEANATMAVVVPGSDPRWHYRLPAIEKIYRAVAQMLADRVGRV